MYVQKKSTTLNTARTEQNKIPKVIHKNPGRKRVEFFEEIVDDMEQLKKIYESFSKNLLELKRRRVIMTRILTGIVKIS